MELYEILGDATLTATSFCQSGQSDVGRAESRNER